VTEVTVNGPDNAHVEPEGESRGGRGELFEGKVWRSDSVVAHGNRHRHQAFRPGALIDNDQSSTKDVSALVDCRRSAEQARFTRSGRRRLDEQTTAPGDHGWSDRVSSPIRRPVRLFRIGPDACRRDSSIDPLVSRLGAGKAPGTAGI
jgi:hypothetical protein